MERKVNKYLYVWKLWVCYEGTWEDELWEDSLREAKQQQRDYRANCPQYPTKITYARVPNPEHAAV